MLNGFVSDMKLVDCTSSDVRKSRLVVKLLDGSEITSECYDYPRIVRVYLTFIKYKEKNWIGRVSISEVMSGITYDEG